MATIKDVAEKAGVSVATVSRVLSNDSVVTSITKERVLRAIRELKYRPDQVARSLRRRRTNLLGFIASTIENVFFTEAAHAAEQAARSHGYNLIVCNTDENPQQEKSYIEVLDQQLIAGVIIAPAPGDAHHLLPYELGRLPMVLINRRIDHLPFSSITCNDEEAAYTCVQALIAEGKRRIVAITGLPQVSTTEARLHGYRRALHEHQLPVGSEWEICGWAHLEGGYRATRQAVMLNELPDALFVFNNVMVQGAIMALQDMGISWPEPLDVAGFGGFKTARMYRPPLMLIQQPAREMGRQATEHLIAQIEHQVESTPQHVVLQNRVVERGEWLSPETSAH